MNIAQFLSALDFAARKHRLQKRKDAAGLPYINHPISVAHVLAVEGNVSDEMLLVAAVLHDTVEDTETTFEELDARFGADIAGLVREVTDDKRLPKAERKRLQIVHAAEASPAARQLKIADKICNIRDVTENPPADWPLERRRDYVVWAQDAIAGCRGVNPRLDAVFDEAVARARQALGVAEQR
jgi:guanosine-3',5'-bis(diphosphate) 3'-pyrophosphohydrolase